MSKSANIRSAGSLFKISILAYFAFTTMSLSLNSVSATVNAYVTQNECCDESEHQHDDLIYSSFSKVNGTMLEQAYLSTHYEDGTMGMVIDETVHSGEIYFEPLNFTHLQRTTVVSSGRPDNESVVAVFLGDGFTSNEQQTFLDRVTEISNYMITVEPFTYYKDYLTVYALHSISNDSGISGEENGKFACRDSFGNPATPECTPDDSSTFNCVHGRDTFYNSYYNWRSSAGRVILEMTSPDRTRARNHALAASSSANMVQIIANSAMRGGTGQVSSSSQQLGVALTSINTSNSNSDWKAVVMHEFGHSFGGLWDEYWNGVTPAEYPNMTRTSNASTVKWNQWVGYKNVGVYPFASTEWDGNPDQATNSWYRPHQNCRMRQTSNPFCPVCVQELLNRMASATGIILFNTTNISTNNIRIDKLNLIFGGAFQIPERIKGRIVTEIGDSAFSDQNQLTQITIPASVTHIGSDAFKNTNNARIELEGKSSSPSTFDPNWNPSNNPVYFNGVECLHTSKTLTYISGGKHGLMCDQCRTSTNVTPHPAINLWRDYYQHHSKCSCGLNQLMAHVVSSSDQGYPYKTCLYCGGPAKDAIGQYDKGGSIISVVTSLFIKQYFGNGSYILQNGIYVISDEDLSSFYDGTLVLPEECEDCHEHFDNHDCVDCTYN